MEAMEKTREGGQMVRGMNKTTGLGTSVAARIQGSLMASVGEIVFGMEDGLVSIFGLVFGVAVGAASADVVLAAGAAGAAAAAVSMGAGAWLDADSMRSHAIAEIEHERQEIEQHPSEELAEQRRQLLAVGFTEPETTRMLASLRRHPSAMLRFEEAYELRSAGAAEANPIAHAVWMFLADAFAAFTPVIPFAVLSLSTARIVSTILAVILLTALGVGRAVYAKQTIWSTVAVTLLIGGGAAAAGVLISSLFV